MEKSKIIIKEEIQDDPLCVSTSSVELKTETFDDNIDYEFQGIEKLNFVECDVNAFLRCSDNEEEVKKTLQKTVDAGSSDNYSSSDSSDEKEKTSKIKLKKKKLVKLRKKEWQCSFCNIFLSSKGERIRHETIHTKGKIF